MRLKCIKLVGFKSFVDATTVHFPSNMCGVVGPNGCGKSNIIDAVRWVMGESSAKNLRGESMTDVIFKGSKARKPAGYAQVELIFDNTEGRITGEYAAYTELSVKRRLTSDAQNSYFLNGTKCRRRDIMDIFLGTGLGPRSYSIISQGMISNLIESKPEELRVFIEEAAGISKYKERRRETENRIRRTTENMERLNDLREELDRRLSHLKHQAEAAEKYKKYKEEERQKRAQLYALRWKELNGKLQNLESAIGKHEVNMEAAVAKQVSGNSQIEQLRIDRQDYDDKFQAIQSRFYKVGNDITRLEQTIAHQEEKQEKLSTDLQESEALCIESEAQIDADKEALSIVEEEIKVLLPEHALISEREEECQDRLLQAEDAMIVWQKKWDVFNEKSGKSRRDAEVAQSGIQHVEQVLTRLSEQIDRDKEELALIDNADESEEIESLEALLLEKEDQCTSLATQMDKVAIETQGCRDAIEKNTLERNNCQQKLSESQGKKASLTALQQAALSQGEKSKEWLVSSGLDKAIQLAETFKVKAGWETAVETVLGDFLQSISVDDLHTVIDQIESETEVNLSFVTRVSGPKPKKEVSLKNKTTLIELIEGANDISLFEGIFVADTLKEALEVQSTLNAGESVVIKEGVWLGVDWLRVAKDKDVTSGVFSRQQALDALEVDIASFEEKSEILKKAFEEQQVLLQECESSQKEAGQTLAENHQALGELKAELQARKTQIEQELSRRSRLKENLAHLQEQYEEEQATLGEHRMVLQKALDAMEADNQEQETLRFEQNDLRKELDNCRQTLHAVKQQMHEKALKKQTLEAQHHARVQAIQRLQDQQIRLSERVKSLQLTISNNNEKAEEDLKEELELLLERKVREEKLMQDARCSLEEANEQLVMLERHRSSAENEVQTIRSKLESLRMDGQAMRIRCTTLQEQLSDEHFDLPTVVNNLVKGVTESGLEKILVKLEANIAQLGAINLAAIEEFDQQSERLHYLDAQHDDLNKALDTLQQAIDRIDKETRHRFELTFNRINEGLKEIFPRVFGGGYAYLEQTSDDLLNTGVTIMAQPPGKKNSTIHLLSGGEKALTAIALVFSIFRLNPSPFCLLDEVDAPLDDANVGRYTRMVQEMSSQVQFIYVTHNKIAMEAANQLIGVTMHEPGVSRPVSVDIHAAAEMALA